MDDVCLVGMRIKGYWGEMEDPSCGRMLTNDSLMK